MKNQRNPGRHLWLVGIFGLDDKAWVLSTHRIEAAMAKAKRLRVLDDGTEVPQPVRIRSIRYHGSIDAS